MKYFVLLIVIIIIYILNYGCYDINNNQFEKSSRRDLVNE